jgi:site-specific DNA-cytosine methylase
MPRKKSFITLTDQFCGAGGSSIGATMAGAEVRLAMNHWKLAIETHNTNFPNVDHDCTDISAVNPRRTHSFISSRKNPIIHLIHLRNGSWVCTPWKTFDPVA